MKTKPALPDQLFESPWNSCAVGITEPAKLTVNLSFNLDAHPADTAIFPPWIPLPSPHDSFVSCGTVGNPVNAALRAPTLSIDCSTSRPLINNLEPFEISIGIAEPLASCA